jgi:hypothetical protein
MEDKTFLGDHTRELKRAHEPIDAIGEAEAEDPLQAQAQEVKKLVADIFDGKVSEFEARAHLEQVPREALIRAALEGVAHYYKQETIWGSKAPTVQKLKLVTDYRLSLLTEEERERAESLAEDWLDDNFSK